MMRRLGASHEQEREYDTADKDPFGNGKLDIDRAVRRTFRLDRVRPLRSGPSVDIKYSAKRAHMIRYDHGCCRKDVQAVHDE